MADKMMRIAGRGDDGLAKAIKTDNNGNVGVQLMGSGVTLGTRLVDENGNPVKQPIDLQDHMIPDTKPLPVSVVNAQNKNAQEVILADGLQIRDTNTVVGTPQNISHLTGQKNILIFNTLNQIANVTVYLRTATGKGFQLMTKAANAGATPILTDVDIPVLKGPIQVLYVNISCASAPTSGSISVFLEGVSL